MEKWKDVVGYEGLYKISSRGRVLSYGKRKRTTVLRQCKNNFGYMQVKLCKNSIRKNTYIHRMVGESFIGPSNMFDHRDQNPKNNSLSNIRKCNKSTNGMNRGKRNGGTSQYMGVHFHKENTDTLSKCESVFQLLNFLLLKGSECGRGFRVRPPNILAFP